MSQENVEVVRLAADAMTQRGLDAFADYCTDDIDHRPVEGALDDRGPIHGKAEMRAYLQDWFDTFDDLRAEPVGLIDAGEDQVVAVLRLMWRAKLSCAEPHLAYARLYPIREGKIAPGREYRTKEQAL